MSLISVRVTKEEKEILKQAKKIYNCGISTLLKKIVFEKLEDDFDLKMIEEYEEDKKKADFKYLDIEDVWKELDL